MDWRGRDTGVTSVDCVKDFHTIRRSEATPGTSRGKQKLLWLKGFTQWAIQDLNLVPRTLGPRFGRIAVALNSLLA